MAGVRCPNCGAEVPSEAGQHALTPSAGVVRCPSCGASVTLDKPGAEPDQAGAEGVVETADAAPPGVPGPEEFSGEETVEGVMDEIRDKEDS